MDLSIKFDDGPEPDDLGDNLNDGSFDVNESSINFPNVNSTPKNYKVEFILNFDGTGTYTITQI